MRYCTDAIERPLGAACCVLTRGHLCAHQGKDPKTGAQINWTDDGTVLDTAPAGASFDELLEHLDDLAQLAANEMFMRFAVSLSGLLAAASSDKEFFGQQGPVPPASDPRTSN